MSEQGALGIRLTEARETLGWSIGETARRMAVKTTTLKDWESGKTSPRANKLHLLTGILNVPLTWLVDGGDNEIPTAARLGRLERLEQKLERMNGLQQDLLQLSDDIASEITAIRKIDEELEELAA